MTRFLLDTNIMSSVTKQIPSDALLAWMADQNDDDLFISALTIAEIWRGAAGKAQRKKALSVGSLVRRSGRTPGTFAGRVLPFDEKAALAWARLMAEDTTKGRPRSALDMIIAAVAEASGCDVVADNERDFAGLGFVNPLRDGMPS